MSKESNPERQNFGNKYSQLVKTVVCMQSFADASLGYEEMTKIDVKFYVET